MSRKFIDDHVELKSSSVPVATATQSSYNRGHMRLNGIDGTRFVNEGDENNAIWANWPFNRYALEDAFQQAPLLNASNAFGANINFEIIGTNAANAGSTLGTSGGVTLTTTTAANDQVIIQPHQTAKQSAWKGVNWATDDRVVFEANFKTGASVAATTVWAGLKLTNTSVVATDNDQVFLRYDSATAGGVIQLISSNNNVDTTTNSTIVVAANTNYHVKIVVDKNRIPQLFVNGVRAAKGAALQTGINLIPYIGVQTTTTAAKAITVRGLKLSKDLT